MDRRPDPRLRRVVAAALLTWMSGCRPQDAVRQFGRARSGFALVSRLHSRALGIRYVRAGSAGGRRRLSRLRHRLSCVLTDGFNHVAILTADTKRLHAFYRDVFDAEVMYDGAEPGNGGVHMSVVQVGPHSEFNVFQVDGNTEASRQTPMFGRGRIDHLALQAASLHAFETIRERLMARGAADEFVTDFGPILSVFFRDPDGLECEVCVTNPDAVPGVHNPPGTRAARYPARP